MADTKISALPASTTPLAGTEVLPIVQGGATKQVSVANLTAGRVISANGVTFPATASLSSDPNTLDDYEEGTFNATLTSATPPSTPITATGYYTKVGDTVTVYCPFRNVNTTGAAGDISVTGLPFTSSASAYAVGSAWCSRATTLNGLVLNISLSSTTVTLIDFVGNAVSWLTAGASTFAGFEITYKV